MTNVFVNFSAIQSEGFKSWTAADAVEFDIVEGEKGQQVADVKKT